MLGPKIAIVTFSVDPQNDTVAKLFEYSRKHHANPFVWFFLTGEKAKTEKTIVENFKMTVGKAEMNNAGLLDIAHSERLVLIDGEGQVRGFYSIDKNDINKMMIDIGLLINFSKGAQDGTVTRAHKS